MTGSLDNLLRTGQLKREPPAQQELDGLIRSALARLRDAERRVLASAHQKRNHVEYEGVADIDEQLVAAVLRVTREVAARVQKLPPAEER